MKTHFLSLVILVLALSACAPAANPPTPTADPNTPVITLERTVCFGTCPVYTLAIYADGRVEYNGADYVEVKGQQTGAITTAQVQELLQAFKDADYFNLKDTYEAPVTDMPTVITSVNMDGKTKSISNYGGCLGGSPDPAPQALCELPDRIDAVANTAQWTGAH